MTDRLTLPIVIIMFVLAFGLVASGALTPSVVVNLSDLPQDCDPGQVAVATGTGDEYTWICGDLP